MSRAFLQDHRYDRLSNAVAAGTTDINSASVDLSVNNGYRGVVFEVHFGAITANAVTSVKAQESSDNSTWSDLADTGSTVADTDDNGVVLLDVYRPTKRYIRCVVDRGTQNAVVDTIGAWLYEPNVAPVSQSADVISSEIHVSPAAGTA